MVFNIRLVNKNLKCLCIIDNWFKELIYIILVLKGDIDK